jgi:hypothetical protein
MDHVPRARALTGDAADAAGCSPMALGTRLG